MSDIHAENHQNDPPAAVFERYGDLSNATKAVLDKIVDFVNSVDGKTIATESGDGFFVDEGTIDTEDVVIAFNAIVGMLRKAAATQAAQ